MSNVVSRIGATAHVSSREAVGLELWVLDLCFER